MTDSEIRAAQDLTAGSRADYPGEPVLFANAATISPALNVCSFTSITTRP